jgi:hypothetical protein
MAIEFVFFCYGFEGLCVNGFYPAATLVIVRDVYIYNTKDFVFGCKFLNHMQILGSIFTLWVCNYFLTFGHENLCRSLWGGDYVASFPINFIIGKVFIERDVLKMGRRD